MSFLLSGTINKPGDIIPFFHWNFFHLLVWFGALHFPDAHGIDLGGVINGLFSGNVTVIASNNRKRWGVELVCRGSGGGGEAGAVGAHLHPLLRQCLTPHCPLACSPGSPQTPSSRSSRLCQRHLPWAAQSRCAAISRWWHVHCAPHTSWISHAGPVKPEIGNYPIWCLIVPVSVLVHPRYSLEWLLPDTKETAHLSGHVPTFL